MAMMKLSSSNEKLSFIIKKNPSNGMIGREIRKGAAFGWFANNNSYCIAFFDGMDETSFPKHENEQFSYIDLTRFNAPLIVPNLLKEFLHTAFRKKDVDDVEGFENTLQILSIDIKRISVIEKVISSIDGFDVKIEKLPHEKISENRESKYNNYTVTVTTKKTIFELLNFAYMMGYIIAVCDKIEFTIDMGILTRIIEACNIVDAPYYVRHIIRCWCISSTSIFSKVEAELNCSKKNKLEISPHINMLSRLFWIKSFVDSDTDIVDFGCGEGMFFSISKKIPSSMYYAIENNEEVRQIAEKKIKNKEYDNIVLLNSIEDFYQIETSKDYIVIMSEIFEHNQLSFMKNVLDRFIKDKHCTKIILTTPNRDFNKFYFIEEGEKRHEDHIFEMNKEEAIEFFTNLTKDTDMKLKYTDIGDRVDDIPTILGFVFTRKKEGEN